MSTSNRDLFIDAYVECALWADAPEEEYAAEAESTIIELTDEAGRFFDTHEADILAYEEGIATAGHDLWLSRNGHGAGYWENHSEAAERLDAAAKELGECYLYVGDDGLLYCA